METKDYISLSFYGKELIVSAKILLSEQSIFTLEKNPQSKYVIDRDFDLFKDYVLKYLTDKKINLFPFTCYKRTPKTDQLYANLLDESRYYRIKGLEKCILEKIPTCICGQNYIDFHFDKKAEKECPSEKHIPKEKHHIHTGSVVEFLKRASFREEEKISIGVVKSKTSSICKESTFISIKCENDEKIHRILSSKIKKIIVCSKCAMSKEESCVKATHKFISA